MPRSFDSPQAISRLASLTSIAAQLTTRLAARLTIGVLVVAAYGQPAYSQPTNQSVVSSTKANPSCPAALDRMRSHTVSSGDTLASVAAAYRIAPNTLARFNPGIGSSLSPGSTLAIPPFNGVVVSPAAGDTWQTVAERYESRADLLFEINGCVADLPGQIFVPGAIGPSAAPGAIATRSTTVTQQLGYPLARPANVALSYGWQPHSTRDELVFNSGIAFIIPNSDEVLAATGGTVAFAGAQAGLGQMVVINHSQGLQTRYANLSEISVSVGQAVAAQATVGKVGGNSDPTFMYFEVRTNSDSGWIAQDPGRYLPDLELR